MVKLKKLLVLAVFAVFSGGLASADVYRVGGIAVDETAANFQEARTRAYSKARVQAAQKLIQRLTLPEDRQAATSPIEPADIARFYEGTDTEAQDQTTATRYISVLAIRFDADAVRDYLEARNVPYVDGQAGKALLIAMTGQNLDPISWGQVWADATNTNGLTPYVASPRVWDRPPAWTDVQGEVASSGASRAIVASAYVSGGQLYVRLSELGPAGSEQIAVAGPYASMPDAQPGAVLALERAWKRASVVRTSGSTAISAIAKFQSLGEWVAIQKAMDNSRIVKELNVESVSSKGADMKFVFAGRPDQLAADLRSRGLTLSGTDEGWTVEILSN